MLTLLTANLTTAAVEPSTVGVITNTSEILLPPLLQVEVKALVPDKILKTLLVLVREKPVPVRVRGKQY